MRFRQSYALIAQKCRVPDYGHPETDVLALVKSWLERKDHGQWLMIIDDADDAQLFPGRLAGSAKGSASNEEGDLSRYIPECTHGSILITSRNRKVALGLSTTAGVFQVRQLNNDESVQLLRTRLVGDHLESDELSALSSLLEYLPLALVQAAASVEEYQIPISEYLKLLKESDQALANSLSKEFENAWTDRGGPCSVTTTWILSFELIQQQNPLAGELLLLLSLFDRQAIPKEFLFSYSKQRKDQTPIGPLELTSSIGVLKGFSFVAEEMDGSLYMHRLTQLVIREWLVKHRRMEHFAGQALLAVLHKYPNVNFYNRATCRKYHPHACAVLQFEGSGSMDERYGKAALFQRIGAFLLEDGQVGESVRWLEECCQWGGPIPRGRQPTPTAITVRTCKSLPSQWTG